MGPFIILLILLLSFLLGVAGIVGLGGTGLVLLFMTLRGRRKSTARRVAGVLAAGAMLVTAFGCLLPVVVIMAKVFYDFWAR